MKFLNENSFINYIYYLIISSFRTHIGRARAWLRLALMQKKLADYFRLLIERRDDLLTEFYEPGALMLADEAIVIMGLLVGLNVIDCNLCVKVIKHAYEYFSL